VGTLERDVAKDPVAAKPRWIVIPTLDRYSGIVIPVFPRGLGAAPLRRPEFGDDPVAVGDPDDLAGPSETDKSAEPVLRQRDAGRSHARKVGYRRPLRRFARLRAISGRAPSSLMLCQT
jgi:hypothetical protein